MELIQSPLTIPEFNTRSGEHVVPNRIYKPCSCVISVSGNKLDLLLIEKTVGADWLEDHPGLKK